MVVAYNKKECSEWKKKKNVNPKTDRKIKTKKRTYNKIAKDCRSHLTEKQICKKWKKDKKKSTIKVENPKTGRQLMRNKVTYKKLNKFCQGLKKKSLKVLLKELPKQFPNHKKSFDFLKLFIRKYGLDVGTNNFTFKDMNINEIKKIMKEYKLIRRNIHPDRFGELTYHYPKLKEYINKFWEQLELRMTYMKQGLDYLKEHNMDVFPEHIKAEI
jgi:hypothetical protein